MMKTSRTLKGKEHAHGAFLSLWWLRWFSLSSDVVVVLVVVMVVTRPGMVAHGFYMQPQDLHYSSHQLQKQQQQQLPQQHQQPQRHQQQLQGIPIGNRLLIPSLYRHPRYSQHYQQQQQQRQQEDPKQATTASFLLSSGSNFLHRLRRLRGHLYCEDQQQPYQPHHNAEMVKDSETESNRCCFRSPQLPYDFAGEAGEVGISTQKNVQTKTRRQQQQQQPGCGSSNVLQRRRPAFFFSIAALAAMVWLASAPAVLASTTPVAGWLSTTTATTTATTTTTTTTALTSSSNYLVRIVFLRAMAFVHFVAFVIALRQNKALIGDNGLTPARFVLKKAQKRGQMKRDNRLQRRQEQQQLQRQNKQQRQQLGERKSTAAILKFFGMTTTTTPMKNPLQLHTQSLMAWLDTLPWFVRFREVWWDRSDARGRPLPTVLWLADWQQGKLNRWLDGIAWTGIVISGIILGLGAANVPLVFALWLCQRSLWSVGGPWYGYGWEAQLAELSFHTLFLVPLFSLQVIPPSSLSPMMSPIVEWTVQWYLFRIMMGAGLIKLRAGDVKWKNLTAMQYFYETQPVPNPLSRYFHFMPKVWHKCETILNHFIELVVPWFLLIPPPSPQLELLLPTSSAIVAATTLMVTTRRVAGLIQVFFQMVLITSGNLSFLNWLTMVPAIMCWDDAFLAPLFGTQTRQAAALAATSMTTTTMTSTPSFWIRSMVSLGFLLWIVQLSIPVVQNLCSKKQIMNASFDPLRLVNTYGAFGVVEEERYELVISACNGVDWEDWREYQFPVKPGNVYKAPKFISPYHYRLDWQLWIAASMRRVEKSPWLYVLLLKLLEQDPQVLQLLDRDPFANDGTVHPPKYIRIEKYKYRFHKRSNQKESKKINIIPDDDKDQNGEGRDQRNATATTLGSLEPQQRELERERQPYWDRELVGRFYPRQGIASVATLKDEIAKAGLFD